MNEDTEITTENLDDHTPELVVQATRGIEEQRVIIDEIDDQIIRLLAQRFAATERVGQLKAQAGFAPLDASRESRQLKRMTELARQCKLDEEIAHAYRDFVVGLSKNRHRQITQGKAEN